MCKKVKNIKNSQRFHHQQSISVKMLKTVQYEQQSRNHCKKYRPPCAHTCEKCALKPLKVFFLLKIFLADPSAGSSLFLLSCSEAAQSSGMISAILLRSPGTQYILKITRKIATYVHCIINHIRSYTVYCNSRHIIYISYIDIEH